MRNIYSILSISLMLLFIRCSKDDDTTAYNTGNNNIEIIDIHYEQTEGEEGFDEKEVISEGIACMETKTLESFKEGLSLPFDDNLLT